jgi:hypothetical protein
MLGRPHIAALGLLAVFIAISVPAIAASPSASAPPSGATATEKPEKSPRPAKAEKAHEPEVKITLSGTVSTSTDAKGRSTYTLRSGSTTYTLEAGPAWFYGDKHPLKPFVGKSVTIVGEQETGSAEVDVLSVNGTAIREPGRPPWAGGWKRVGEKHPGWSQEKADRFKAKFGDCFPPGQCKDKSGKPDADDEAPSPSP